MLIKNVRIFTEEKRFRPGSIEIREGRISAVRYDAMRYDAVRDDVTEEEHVMDINGGAAGKEDRNNVTKISGAAVDYNSVTKKINAAGGVVDGGGCYALPGMIDMHFHGSKGWDICDLPGADSDDEAGQNACQRDICGLPDAEGKAEEEAAVLRMWQEIADYQASLGVTAMAPATMTLPADRLKKTLQYAAGFAKLQKMGKAGGSRLAGIHMEGPFISPARCGAQDVSYILPCSRERLTQFLEAGGGLVKVMGIAPEKEGALTLIEQMKDRVRFSFAHTDADYETARRALEAGVRHATHLFNAMPPWNHRKPGVVGAVLDAAAEGREFTAELICDGFHIHPSVIRTVFRLLGEDRVILVSDSMRAAGMSEGEYTLGGQQVLVRDQQGKGKTAVLKKDGSLAGSVVSLPDCVRMAVRKAGVPLEQAAAAATINPAKCLGIEKEQGTISAGRRADIVLWDQELRQRMVICHGEILK